MDQDEVIFPRDWGMGGRKLFGDLEIHVTVLAWLLIHSGDDLISGLPLEKLGCKVTSDLDISRLSVLSLSRAVREEINFVVCSLSSNCFSDFYTQL